MILRINRPPLVLFLLTQTPIPRYTSRSICNFYTSLRSRVTRPFSTWLGCVPIYSNLKCRLFSSCKKREGRGAYSTLFPSQDVLHTELPGSSRTQWIPWHLCRLGMWALQGPLRWVCEGKSSDRKLPFVWSWEISLNFLWTIRNDLGRENGTVEYTGYSFQ